MAARVSLALCGATFVLAGGCVLDDRGMTFLGNTTGSVTGTSGNQSHMSDAGEASSNHGGTASLGGANDSDGGDDEPGAAGATGSEGGQDGSGGTPNTGGSSAGAGGSSAGSGGGSAGSGGGSAGSGGGSAGTGGSGGGGGSGGEPFISPCGDLNDNRRDDCEETIVQNSRFDAAAMSWEAEAKVQVVWSPTNATSATGSGSLSVSNTNLVANASGNTAVGSRQCLTAWGNESLDIAARVFIAEGQGSGKGALNVAFYGHDDCSGAFLEGQTIATSQVVGVWSVARGTVKLPAATRSIQVRLLASKPLGQASLEVLFDDVLVAKD